LGTFELLLAPIGSSTHYSYLSKPNEKRILSPFDSGPLASLPINLLVRVPVAYFSSYYDTLDEEADFTPLHAGTVFSYDWQRA